MATPSQPKMRVKGGVLDSWSVREKLALGCSVQRSGDQNWVSVSRAIKPYGEPHRPADWFQPRNCATQYSSLLEKVETPKRKRTDRGEIEIPTKQIVVKLTIERIEELKKQVLESQQQYKKLKHDLESIYTGQWDDQIKEKLEEAQAVLQVEEEAKKEEERKLKEMYVARAAAQNHLKVARRTSASSQSISEPDDTTQDSLVDNIDESPAYEDSLDSSLLGSGPPTVTLPCVPIPVTADSSAAKSPNLPPSPLLSHLLKSSTSTIFSLQRIKQEQEQVMKQEQQPMSEKGDSATQGDANTECNPATEDLPSVLLPLKDKSEEEEEESNVSLKTVVKEEPPSEFSDVVSSQEKCTDEVTEELEVKEEATSQDDETANESSSDQITSALVVPKIEPCTEEDTEESRTEQNADVEIESQDEEKTDLDGTNDISIDEISTKDPASPASSVLSNLSEARSGGHSRGRGSHEQTIFRSARRNILEKDDTSSKHSDTELTDDDTTRETYDILSHLSSQPTTTTAAAFTESVPNSPSSTGISDTEDEKAYKTWKKSIMLVWRAAANHKYANVFLHPVTDDIAPGYHNVVLRSMDMLSIKKNIENGVTRTTAEFQRDMMLMFTNAIMYNSSNHNVYSMAKEMYDDVMAHIEQYVSAQLMVQSSETKMLRPSRRGETSEKEEEPKKRRGSVEQPLEGGKIKKRKCEEIIKK